jgi:hypothetical protein
LEEWLYTSSKAGEAPWVGYYEEGQGGMKGTPWEFKEGYYMNSPFFFSSSEPPPYSPTRLLNTRYYVVIVTGQRSNQLNYVPTCFSCG